LDITYEKRKAIKSQVLPDFIAEWLELQNTGPPDLSSFWTMYFNGSKRVQGAGAWVVLISPQGDKLKYVLRMSFSQASNYESEYEALLHGEAGKNIKVTGDPVYNLRCLALTCQQHYMVWPDKFKPDIGARYDGTSNPIEFLQVYVIAIQAARGDQRAMANWFPMALKDAPRTWLMNLLHKSVTSWKDLCRQFVANFMPTYERPATKNDLKVVRQYKGETLLQYIQHFSQMRNKIPRISNKEVISVFSMGVADIKIREKLSVNDELTSIVRLFEIADRCTKAEEGRLFVHNLPEALPPKPKSKDPKRKEAATLMAEPDHKQRRGDHSEHDKGRRHRYCILPKKDTHNTDDCCVV
jgi:hypothetical protein